MTTCRKCGVCISYSRSTTTGGELCSACKHPGASAPTVTVVPLVVEGSCPEMTLRDQLAMNAPAEEISAMEPPRRRSVMDLGNTPAIRLTERIMAAIKEHLKEGHYHAVYECIHRHVLADALVSLAAREKGGA